MSCGIILLVGHPLDKSETKFQRPTTIQAKKSPSKTHFFYFTEYIEDLFENLMEEVMKKPTERERGNVAEPPTLAAACARPDKGAAIQEKLSRFSAYY